VISLEPITILILAMSVIFGLVASAVTDSPFPIFLMLGVGFLLIIYPGILSSSDSFSAADPGSAPGVVDDGGGSAGGGESVSLNVSNKTVSVVDSDVFSDEDLNLVDI